MRLLRRRKGLTQTAVSKLPESVDHRSLSHWETGRKLPALKNVVAFLSALEFDFHDLQDALNAVGSAVEPRAMRVDQISEMLDLLHQRLVGVERRISVVERRLSEGMAAATAPIDQ